MYPYNFILASNLIHSFFLWVMLIDISHKISKIRLKNAKFAKSSFVKSWGRMNLCDDEWK